MCADISGSNAANELLSVADVRDSNQLGRSL